MQYACIYHSLFINLTIATATSLLSPQFGVETMMHLTCTNMPVEALDNALAEVRVFCFSSHKHASNMHISSIIGDSSSRRIISNMCFSSSNHAGQQHKRPAKPAHCQQHAPTCQWRPWITYWQRCGQQPQHTRSNNIRSNEQLPAHQQEQAVADAPAALCLGDSSMSNAQPAHWRQLQQ